MGFYDVLKTAADAAGMPLARIGQAMGRNASYVSGNMARGSVPQVDNAAAMLAACGWALLAAPADVAADAVAAGALAVEPPAADAADADRRALERKRERLRRELEQTERLLG